MKLTWKLLQGHGVSSAGHEELAAQQHHSGLLIEGFSRAELQYQRIPQPMPHLPQSCRHKLFWSVSSNMQKPDEFVQAPGYKNLYRRYESDVQKEKQYQHSLLLVLSQSCSTKASLMNTREYHTSNKVCQRKLGRCKGSVAATVLLFCGKTCPVVACRPWRTKTKLTCSIMQMHDQLHCLAQCQHMTETYKCRC